MPIAIKISIEFSQEIDDFKTARDIIDISSKVAISFQSLSVKSLNFILCLFS